MKAVTIDSIREDFPILHQKINGQPLVYLDNGATSQKPTQVIQTINDYYQLYNSNIHRGVHELSQIATTKYEEARKKVQGFLHAKNTEEIIFTSGTTESINLVATIFAQKNIQKDDEIIISALEHHSNIVPWQMICEQYGANLKIIPINTKGELIIDELKSLITAKTKLIAVNHVSNALGTINPIKEIIDLAHQHNVYVLIDGAQAVPHMAIDVQQLNCDFYVFSAHKMLGPTGVGVLYGKKEILNNLPPYKGGGDMIKEVTFEKTTYNDLPHRLEAGTPNIAGGIALGTAIDYMLNIGFNFIEKQEKELLTYATTELKKIEGIRIIGEAENKAGVLSFLLDDIHPFDLGTILDQLGVAIRTGHHCTQPIMSFFNIPGTARASFAFYNTKQEIDIFIAAVKKAAKMLR